MDVYWADYDSRPQNPPDSRLAVAGDTSGSDTDAAAVLLYPVARGKDGRFTCLDPAMNCSAGDQKQTRRRKRSIGSRRSNDKNKRRKLQATITGNKDTKNDALVFSVPAAPVGIVADEQPSFEVAPVATASGESKSQAPGGRKRGRKRKDVEHKQATSNVVNTKELIYGADDELKDPAYELLLQATERRKQEGSSSSRKTREPAVRLLRLENEDQVESFEDEEDNDSSSGEEQEDEAPVNVVSVPTLTGRRHLNASSMWSYLMKYLRKEGHEDLSQTERYLVTTKAVLNQKFPLVDSLRLTPFATLGFEIQWLNCLGVHLIGQSRTGRQVALTFTSVHLPHLRITILLLAPNTTCFLLASPQWAATLSIEAVKSPRQRQDEALSKYLERYLKSVAIPQMPHPLRCWNLLTTYSTLTAVCRMIDRALERKIVVTTRVLCQPTATPSLLKIT